MAATVAIDNAGSIKHAEVDDGTALPAQFPGVPASDNDPRSGENTPAVLYVLEYTTSAVLTVRQEATAEASLAAIFERSKFGIAIAAMIKIIATTINNSMTRNPFVCYA